MIDNTASLLGEHADLMNQYGADSREVSEFVSLHQGNAEFVKLSRVSKDIWKAFRNKPKPRASWWKFWRRSDNR